jgi:glucose uptake protein
MGAFFPLAAWAREGDNGLGPYSLALLLSLGVFVSTFVYNIYFLNLPVQGPALGMAQYFTGTRKQHVLGLLGGIVWCAGLLAMLTEQSAPQRAQPGHILSFGLVQAVPLLAAAWGIFAWREFHGAGTAVKGMLAAMFLLFAAGVLLIGMAG